MGNRYTKVSAFVFSLVALAQLARVAMGVQVEINHWPVPMAASIGVALFTGALAAWGWRSR
jgi:hypothetical protein